MKRILYIAIALLLSAGLLQARDTRKARLQEQDGKHRLVTAGDTLEFSDAYLDSVNVRKQVVINDYTLIGVHYGVNMNSMMWNPRREQTSQIVPMNIGVTWTRYGKMFGYMPFFGLQAGIFYTKEGYILDEGYELEGVSSAKFDVIEVPALAHFHFDFWKMKLMANIGLYGSYRFGVHKTGESLTPEQSGSFLATDKRWDYGIKGGAGFGFVFDPVEIHFNAMYKWGLGSLFEPDYYSKYYYRYATVSNFVFSVSLHFQLTKRIGRTKHELKKEARRQIEEGL